MFKTLEISQNLVETLRAPFVVNAKGELSESYKFCLCCLYQLQAVFNAFDTWRRRELLIANCKWVQGQLTNVLNMLYPNLSNPLRPIYITGATGSYTYAPRIQDGGSTEYGPRIQDGSSTVYGGRIQDAIITSTTPVIYYPSEIIGTTYQNVLISVADITATLEQIRLSGTPKPLLQSY